MYSPATKTSCHYWFGAARPKDRFLAQQAEMEMELLRGPFAEEDAPMLAAQQEAFGDQDFWKARPIILRDDAAAIRARRTLDKLIREEQSSPASNPLRAIRAVGA